MKRANRLLEFLFMALSWLYLAYRTSNTTTLNLPWPVGTERRLLIALAVLALARLALSPLRRWKTPAALGLALIYYLVYRSDGYRFLLFLAATTVGCIDIDYRRVLKVYLASAGVVACAAIAAGMMGAITNYVNTTSGRGVRSAWGICYPTDFATRLLFLLMILWILCRRLPDWAMLLISVGNILVARYIAFSWNNIVCGAAFAAAILWEAFDRRVIGKNKRLGWMRKGVDGLASIAFPVFALSMFALMYLYSRDTDIGNRLNSLLSNRLDLSVARWRTHGLTPFGTPFTQQGNGFSIIQSSKYNFVDSSYPLILLRYGWVLLAALCLCWCLMSRKAIRIGDRRLALVLALVALHSFMEHHFIESHYNILLVMPLAAFQSPGRRKRLKARPRRPAPRAAAIACALTMLACGAILWFALPPVLSGMRTVLDVVGLSGGTTAKAWALTGVMAGFLAFIAAAVWGVYRLLACLLSRMGMRRALRPALALLVCACVGCVGWMYADNMLDAAAAQNAEMIEADRAALEIAVKAATGKVYSGVLPSVYHREIDGLSYSAFFEDDLARLYGDTVLLPSSSERGVFIHCGFLYAPISDTHALYSGDRAVIDALMDAGYHVTGYYSAQRSVNLATAAKNNKLTYDEATGVRLNKVKRPLKKGPYYSLFGGRYTVTYDLSLPEGATPTDDVVCTLSVTLEKNAKVLLEREVRGGEFDEQGRLSVPIPFTIDDTKSVAFCARIEKGRTVYIRDIRFVRTPELDVHAYYDSRLRVIREEYYNLDGRPAEQSLGYYSMDQAYDKNGNVSTVRYYGADGQLALRTDGFAERHWTYNSKNLVVREEFYGTDGKPVMISSRQAANEREYDAAGNVVVQRYFDAEGLPCVATLGYAEVRRQYDDAHRVVREEYFGADGRPIQQTSGNVGLEQEYDEAGNLSVVRFLGETGLVSVTDGYAEVRRRYNGLHQVIHEAYFDGNGDSVKSIFGYASEDREYDVNGNTTVRRFYDEAGLPVVMFSGYAELRRVYDDRRLVIRESYYGADGQPLPLHGYASLEREYNDQREVRAQRHYGVDGEPALTDDGYFELRREFDGAGRVAVESYFDAQGNAMCCARGYASVRSAYNDLDQLAEESYYGLDGSPATVGAGYTRTLYEYLDDRQLYLVSYVDEDGALAQVGSGYLHEYLNSLMGRDVTVFISAKDDALRSLPVAILEDLKALGIQSDLRGRSRYSFYAVISPGEVVEDLSSASALSREGTVGDVGYAISSAGYHVGNYSSIMIGGAEYSKNYRGLNFAVYDNALKQVTDAVCVDTFLQEMTVIR